MSASEIDALLYLFDSVTNKEAEGKVFCFTRRTPDSDWTAVRFTKEGLATFRNLRELGWAFTIDLPNDAPMLP